MNKRKTSYEPAVPVFQHDHQLQALPGGFALITDGWPDGFDIPAGTAIWADETERTAVPVKTAAVAAAVKASDQTTALTIEKGHCIAPEDELFGIKVDTVADAGLPGLDEVNLAADVPVDIAKGAKAGTGDGNALLLHPVTVKKGDVQMADAIVGGMVYERRIGYVSERTKKNLPNVVFTNSK